MKNLSGWAANHIPPMPDGSAVEVTFPGALEGVEPSFVFHYGFADAPKSDRERPGAIVTLAAGLRRLDRLDVPYEGGWRSAELVLPEDAGEDLVVRVSVDGAGVPPLCIGAVLRPRGSVE